MQLGAFLMKSSGCASHFAHGQTWLQKWNGGADERLRGDKRLIGFVDHLSMKKEADNDGTLEDEKKGLGSTRTDWQWPEWSLFLLINQVHGSELFLFLVFLLFFDKGSCSPSSFLCSVISEQGEWATDVQLRAEVAVRCSQQVERYCWGWYAPGGQLCLWRTGNLSLRTAELKVGIYIKEKVPIHTDTELDNERKPSTVTACDSYVQAGKWKTVFNFINSENFFLSNVCACF